MKHHSGKRKLGRERGERIALIRSLAESLVLQEKILTTEARAKEVRPYVERLITAGKRATLAARRDIRKKLGGRTPVMKKIVEDLSVRYKDRAGGYTRIIKAHLKASDGRKVAVIELVK